jgi:hypothetical protein
MEPGAAPMSQMTHPPIPPNCPMLGEEDGKLVLYWFGELSSCQNYHPWMGPFGTVQRRIISCVARCAWADYAATMLGRDVAKYDDAIANTKAWKKWGEQ